MPETRHRVSAVRMRVDLLRVFRPSPLVREVRIRACGRSDVPDYEPSRAGPSRQNASVTGVTASPAPNEERKLATVLFADLVGSTALADSEDPERTRAKLNR